jgi:hypothetical protein
VAQAPPAVRGRRAPPLVLLLVLVLVLLGVQLRALGGDLSPVRTPGLSGLMVVVLLLSLSLSRGVEGVCVGLLGRVRIEELEGT